MGKGLICVAIFCVCNMIVFGVVLYLMKDINPPPLKSEDDNKFYEFSKSDIKDNPELKFETVIFEDAPKVEVLQYGLEKFDNEHLEYSTYIPQGTGTAIFDNLWKYTPRKVIPPLWPSTTVVTGTRPTLSSPPNITDEEYNTTETWEDYSLNNQTETKNETEISDTNYTSIIVPVKRSVRDFKKNGRYEIPQPILLKILDESNQFKIEIKVGPSETTRKRYRENRSSLKNKSKCSISLQSQSRDELLINELAKNIVISILPNDSAIVDEYDYDDNLSEDHIIEKGLSEINKEVSKTGNIYSNISVHKKTAAHNRTYYENIPNILHFQNTPVNNITDYENILLFNKTGNIDSNIFHVQNNTGYNITDYSKILLTKLKPKRSGTTKMPIYKDIFTLNLLFDKKTKSIHSHGRDEEDHKNNDISNHLKLNYNESVPLKSELYSDTIIANATAATMDYNSNSTINTENKIENNEKLFMKIFKTESNTFTTVIDTESTYSIIKSSSQNESLNDYSINLTAHEITVSDVKISLVENSTTGSKNILQNESLQNENTII